MSPSSISRPARTSPILPGLPGASRTRSPFSWNTALRDAAGLAEPRLFLHVPNLAVDRHEDLGPDPAIERLQLGPPGMAGDVDIGLPVGDDGHVARGQAVLDPADRDLVAGDLAAGEQHDIARFERDLVVVFGDPRQRGARLALPAGRERSALRRAAGASRCRNRPSAADRCR